MKKTMLAGVMAAMVMMSGCAETGLKISNKEPTVTQDGKYLKFDDDVLLRKNLDDMDIMNHVFRPKLSYPNFSGYQLNKYAHSYQHKNNRRALQAIAQNDNTSSETLDELAKIKDSDLLKSQQKERRAWQVRCAVAENPNTSQKTLEKLSNDKYINVLECVARNPNISQQLYNKLQNISKEHNGYLDSALQHGKEVKVKQEKEFNTIKDKDRVKAVMKFYNNPFHKDSGKYIFVARIGNCSYIERTVTMNSIEEYNRNTKGYFTLKYYTDVKNVEPNEYVYDKSFLLNNMRCEIAYTFNNNDYIQDHIKQVEKAVDILGITMDERLAIKAKVNAIKAVRNWDKEQEVKKQKEALEKRKAAYEKRKAAYKEKQRKLAKERAEKAELERLKKELQAIEGQ